MSVRNGRKTWKSAAVLALSAAATLAGAGCGKQAAPAEKALPLVLYTTSISGPITDFERFTGRTEAFKSVEIRARVTGYLNTVNFIDGKEVAEKTLLFEIDPRPYQAENARASATLAQAEAKEKRLDADYRRISTLYNKGVSTREEFDRADGDLAEGKAAVGIAKAQLDLAKLDLSFTKVYAPIAGRLSRRMVDAGNLVKADETPLTTIVALDPMYVNFDIDERTVLRIRRLIREGKVKSRTESEVLVQAGLADEPDFPHEGTIDFSENKVDAGTGTLRVRGLLKNPPPRVLSPGMFLRVRLPIGSEHPAVMVAEQAISSDQGKKFVYVLHPKVDPKTKLLVNVVEARPILLGMLAEGNMRVVEEGLKPGELVVISGLQRVKAGSLVQAKSLKDELKSQAEKAKSKADAPSSATRADPASPPSTPAPPAGPTPPPPPVSGSSRTAS